MLIDRHMYYGTRVPQGRDEKLDEHDIQEHGIGGNLSDRPRLPETLPNSAATIAMDR